MSASAQLFQLDQDRIAEEFDNNPLLKRGRVPSKGGTQNFNYWHNKKFTILQNLDNQSVFISITDTKMVLYNSRIHSLMFLRELCYATGITPSSNGFSGMSGK